MTEAEFIRHSEEDDKKEECGAVAEFIRGNRSCAGILETVYLQLIHSWVLLLRRDTGKNNGGSCSRADQLTTRNDVADVVFCAGVGAAIPNELLSVSVLAEFDGPLRLQVVSMYVAVVDLSVTGGGGKNSEEVIVYELENVTNSISKANDP